MTDHQCEVCIYTYTATCNLLCFLYFQETFTPAKYFSIDRVFRNETLDATHLAEFHQIEGVVADYDLTLGHLIGILHAFFKKLGQWINILCMLVGIEPSVCIIRIILFLYYRSLYEV